VSIIRQECSTSLDWQTVEVRSSSDKSKTYEVSVPPWSGTEDVTCTCPSYTFRGYCRHTEYALKNLICNWTSDDPVPQTAEQRRGRTCPRCGAPTVLVEGDDE
jgi:hypothetical protein